MFQRLFPRQLDNDYQGHVLAIWLFVPVVLLKTLMGFNVAGLNPWISSRSVLQRADAVPVDVYPADAASHVVFTFAAWGLCLFVLALLAWVVIIRYRAMLPLMILALSTEQVGRMALSQMTLPHHAMAQSGIPISTLINWGLAALLLLALVFSLVDARPRSSRS
jgi:hypothetical protein